MLIYPSPTKAGNAFLGDASRRMIDGVKMTVGRQTTLALAAREAIASAASHFATLVLVEFAG